jgi:hypothetical protein
MPERLDECVEELKRKGYTEEEAWAICKDQLGSEAEVQVREIQSTGRSVRCERRLQTSIMLGSNPRLGAIRVGSEVRSNVSDCKSDG